MSIVAIHLWSLHAVAMRQRFNDGFWWSFQDDYRRCFLTTSFFFLLFLQSLILYLHTHTTISITITFSCHRSFIPSANSILRLHNLLLQFLQFLHSICCSIFAAFTAVFTFTSTLHLSTPSALLAYHRPQRNWKALSRTPRPLLLLSRIEEMLTKMLRMMRSKLDASLMGQVRRIPLTNMTFFTVSCRFFPSLAWMMKNCWSWTSHMVVRSSWKSIPTVTEKVGNTEHWDGLYVHLLAEFIIPIPWLPSRFSHPHTSIFKYL